MVASMGMYASWSCKQPQLMSMMMMMMLCKEHRTYIRVLKITTIIITRMFYRYLKHNLSKWNTLSSSKIGSISLSPLVDQTGNVESASSLPFLSTATSNYHQVLSTWTQKWILNSFSPPLYSHYHLIQTKDSHFFLLKWWPQPADWSLTFHLGSH